MSRGIKVSELSQGLRVMARKLMLINNGEVPADSLKRISHAYLQEQRGEANRAWLMKRYNLKAETYRNVHPLRVLGKRPTNPFWWRFGSWVDHAKLWIRHGGGWVFTSEPYSLLPEALADLRSFCGQHGLRFEVLPQERSVHCPGACHLIVIQAK